MQLCKRAKTLKCSAYTQNLIAARCVLQCCKKYKRNFNGLVLIILVGTGIRHSETSVIMPYAQGKFLLISQEKSVIISVLKVRMVLYCPAKFYQAEPNFKVANAWLRARSKFLSSAKTNRFVPVIT